jgi:hypothetical protein
VFRSRLTEENEFVITKSEAEKLLSKEERQDKGYVRGYI